MYIQDLIIITGHYGSGKTNLAVNLAVDFSEDEKTLLADLDIVNPFFRTADFKFLENQHNIKLILPPYANTNLDTPIITAEVAAAIESGTKLIMDVGGDDNGAKVLGRFAPRISVKPYSMIFVVNAFRPMTDTAKKAAEMLYSTEKSSRLKVSYIVNNSNLGVQTTQQDVLSSVAYAEELSKLTNIPVLFHAVWNKLDTDLLENVKIYPVNIYVKAPWNQGEKI